MVLHLTLLHTKKYSSPFTVSFDFIDWAMKMNFRCTFLSYFYLKIALFWENGEKLNRKRKS
jgi:hypothetical protein